MELTIPTASGDPLALSITVGEQLYVLGANGSGKSALIHHFVGMLEHCTIKRISAHRQSWLVPGAIYDFPQDSWIIEHWDRDDDARYMDPHASQRLSAVLLDFLDKENIRARAIARHVDTTGLGSATRFAETSHSAFEQLNGLLAIAKMSVTLSNNGDRYIRAERPNSDRDFDFALMSDGERNAVIMAAHVITARPNTILLIDEPERHLHRSIIVPFLSALFALREDCAFIISTHETALPVANPTANAIILRSCVWGDYQVRAWDAQVLESGASLPQDLKRDILGARRRILFVEGVPNSLDLPLYGALFPQLTVIPRGSCEEVIRAVKGLRSSYEHHHVEAVGLIDRDGRTEDEVIDLAQDRVFALDVYSVESLYYCSDAIESVAFRQAGSLGLDPQAMSQAATTNALEIVGADEDLPERMAARRSERLVYNRFATHLPDWREIKTAGERLRVSEPIENPFQDELTCFKGLVESGDLDGLVARYPLRESSVFERILTTLKCRNRADYERMVVARIREDERLADKLKQRIKPLSELLDVEAALDS